MSFLLWYLSENEPSSKQITPLFLSMVYILACYGPERVKGCHLFRLHEDMCHSGDRRVVTGTRKCRSPPWRGGILVSCEFIVNLFVEHHPPLISLPLVAKCYIDTLNGFNPTTCVTEVFFQNVHNIALKLVVKI